MMTTGYDCTDILNICMMRPVYSPSLFVQMKGRGTRTHDFAEGWSDKKQSPPCRVGQGRFALFDFFRNYEYFEEDFDYDDPLKLASGSSESSEPPVERVVVEAHSHIEDILETLREIKIPDAGMKVDRNLYRSFREVVTANETIHGLVKKRDFDAAGIYLDKHIMDRPKEFYSYDKLRGSLELDRPLTVMELLLYVFGHIDRIKPLKEFTDDEFDKMDAALGLDDAEFRIVRQAFQAYVTDKVFREKADSGRFGELNIHPSGRALNEIAPDLWDRVVAYISENIDLGKFENVG